MCVPQRRHPYRNVGRVFIVGHFQTPHNFEAESSAVVVVRCRHRVKRMHCLQQRVPSDTDDSLMHLALRRQVQNLQSTQ